MKFIAKVKVTGMKKSKGQMDNGTAFDSSKVYVETGFDESKETARGTASAEYALGDSTEYDKYKHLPLPFDAEAEMEIVTNGRTQKTVVHSLKPVGLSKDAAPASRANASA